MITAWRIYRRRHGSIAFTGEGDRLFGGRWNNPGVAVIYTASTPSLAALEMLVHLDSAEILGQYLLQEVSFPETGVEHLDARLLPKRWRQSAGLAAARMIGDRWVNEGRSLVLAVPSVQSPSELNYLINPAHNSFTQLKFRREISYQYDRRLK